MSGRQGSKRRGGSIFPTEKFNGGQGGSDERDFTSKKASIGNQKQYLHIRSSARAKRCKPSIKQIVKLNSQYVKGRWQSYDSNNFINPAVSNTFTASYSRGGLSLPLNHISNGAIPEQMCPVYCINLSQALRNHRRTPLPGFANDNNTYPTIKSCPMYRLVKIQNIATATYPKWQWQVVYGKHNGYDGNVAVTAQSTARCWHIEDTDYTNVPFHNYKPEWSKIKLYLYGCLRPRTVCTAFGYFTQDDAGPARLIMKQNDAGSWTTPMTFDDSQGDNKEDIALYYEQWVASMVGHPFDRPHNRLKDGFKCINFFKKETINMGVDSTTNKDTNALQAFKTTFYKHKSTILKTYDNSKLLSTMTDELQNYLPDNTAHVKNIPAGTFGEAARDVTVMQEDRKKDLYYFIWCPNQGIEGDIGDYTPGYNWTNDKMYMANTDLDITFDIDITHAQTVFPDLSHSGAAPA